MTSAPISVLSTELEELSRAVGRADIADAAASCRGARDAVLTVALGASVPERDGLLSSAKHVNADDLGPASFRAVRAERLVLVVSARAMLDSASLELVDALLRKRPRAGVAVVLTDVDETFANALANLERRAWRTLVKSPPSDPTGLSLPEYNVFLIGNDAAAGAHRARFADDRAAFARWLSLAEPAADALDLVALLDLCVELRDGHPARPGNMPPASDQDGASNTRKAQVRGRMMGRIDEAVDEIDRAVSAEIRQVSAAARAEVGGARFAAAPAASLEHTHVAAMRRLHECFDRTIRDVGSDLEEALADDLRELGAVIPQRIALEAVIRTDLSWISLPRTDPKISGALENGTPPLGADSFVAGVAGSIAGVSLAKIAMLPIAPLATAGLLAGVAIDTTLRTRRRAHEDKHRRAQAVLIAAFGEAQSGVRAALDEARTSLRERVDAVVDRIEIPSAEPPLGPSSPDARRLDQLLAQLAAHAAN